MGVCASTDESSAPHTMTPPLLRLPAELLQQILGHLCLSDLLSIGLVSRVLQDHTNQDILWQRLVQAEISGPAVSKPAHRTWRELFKEHHPYWFIAGKKLWFADNVHTGKLIVARYDHRLNAIEAYELVAERRVPESLSWDQHPDAIIHTFSPRVKLDLNVPVVRLNSSAYEEGIGRVGHRLQKEIPMNLSRHTVLRSHLLLTRPWPENITTEATPVWPPLTVPSVHRTRNDQSPSGFTQSGHKPGLLNQLSTSTFRLRKWMQFATQSIRFNMRIGENISTWATLPEECYTPTRQKPWQGIWCGDYAGHGCEFLVVMQPDNPRPLPERAEWALRAAEREESVSSEGSWTTAPTDAAHSDDEDGQMENADDLEDSVATLQQSYHERASESRGQGDAQQDGDAVYRGRIEAVKLTGDPNIPRGEYTFIAPDIGPNGLLRVASEEIFQGARIVRSVGHIAATGFRDDNYMASQLILISHDRIAQYWETFGHVSFYERVDIDSFTRV
ncbi:hypothetical protein COCVIDRAFT_41123 [Bipolaris victoriae FI3]|uniref:F-box domain-containing protein n=1 Tax=Bipolaris victoriae (strain FI3) TaxID=930091 RepID=W7E4T3_BIPV3|nr:hypothetical protein COCVIDRAFT_41123 [Bipolaris victoriae FI3]